MACALALLLAVGMVTSGRLPFSFLPRIEGDLVSASLERSSPTRWRQALANCSAEISRAS